VEKGKSVAFTSDANGRWSASWLRWSGGPEFYSEIVESVAPQKGAKGTVLDFDLRSWVEGNELVVDVTLFEDPGGDRVGGEIFFPDDTKRPLDFTPQERGHYQARLPRPLAGKYRSVVTVGQSRSPEVAWALPIELFGERVLPRPNTALLEQLALKTGGKVNPTREDLEASHKEETTRTPVARWFIVLALVLFFVEILAREFWTISGAFGAIRGFKNLPEARTRRLG
jgi:Ca-activated chloride channel family protein